MDWFAEFLKFFFGNLKIVLSALEFDNELFESLLCSMPERLRQVREAEGGNTNF